MGGLGGDWDATRLTEGSKMTERNQGLDVCRTWAAVSDDEGSEWSSTRNEQTPTLLNEESRQNQQPRGDTTD